jgi:hypothetical protein
MKKMPQAPTLLEERYGQKPRERRLNRGIGIVTAVGFTGVLVAWLWWGGVLETPSQLNTRDLGYVLVSESEVVVNFEVTTPPGTEASCAVQALNGSFGVVGWKVVTLTASETWTRTFQELVRTSEPAVTGLLYECWLP